MPRARNRGKDGWRAMMPGHQNIVATIAACGPNRGGARSFRAGGAIFHFTVRLDGGPLPCRCLPAPLRNSVETKTPPGKHHSGVIAAQTRKGGSAFSRANCRNPGTKGIGGRFDSRLWNPEFLLVLHFRPAWLCEDDEDPLLPGSRPPAGTPARISDGVDKARTISGNFAGCPRPGSGAVRRERPRAGQ